MHLAARDLGVTPSAISQQLRTLEDSIGIALVSQEGRRVVMTPTARIYHDLISQGFDRLVRAQEFISSHRSTEELTVSGLPTLLQKWLNPIIHRFQAHGREPSIRIIATHQEADPQLMEQMFRLTYGGSAKRYPHSRLLFQDRCFPACSPDFLAAHPEAATPDGLAQVPLIGIDWSMDESIAPTWDDWFTLIGVTPAPRPKIAAVYSLTGLALEAAVSGQGVVLAQTAFAQNDLETGRLVRLSETSLEMQEGYHICWGNNALTRNFAREFLNWAILESKPRREGTLR
ncbi:LysR substrate-binding domain-containing protein [Gemmobacter fulva]|uniref:LysR substrate-binding domain-containing protein n=1 Tax=Gemmobacter fulvus TaxID=2840474 RepID=UPI0021B09173|nr:LysR substrate-binding domain-containing protein [Gemmobacter fulvus]